MKRYDSYKDSGVQWIGEIPNHWEIARLKFACKNITDGSHFSPKTHTEGKPYVTVSNVNNGLIDTENSPRISNEDFEALLKNGCQPKIGDVLLTKDGSVGRTAIVKNNNFVALSSLGILTPSKILTSGYLRYSLESNILQDQMTNATDGSAIKRITITKICEFLTYIPTLEEQNAISNYLDNKCTKIDNVIATQEKRVELLRELKQSIITRAVTRGIPSTSSGQAPVKMKDSGVEWIGEIPEHWEVQRIKHVVEQIGDVDHYMPKSVEIGIPYVMTGDLQEKASLIEFDSCKQISYQDYLALSKKIKADIDDIIFARYATIGTTCYVDIEKEFIVSYSCVTIKPNKSKIIGKYLIYYMKSNAFAEEVQSYINSNTQGNVGVESLNSTRLAVPPIEEQELIVTYIEQQTSKLDKSINKALRQIELLKEYKQSLITEVVTGKRKVV